MIIQKTAVKRGIYLLTFQTQLELTSTFLRFQEYFESPKFKGKIFTLDEYIAWYKTTKAHGKFSYYTDWTGFNLGSDILKPFYAGKFDPLSDKEKHLLDLFRGEKGLFYIIGTYKRKDNKMFKSVLVHECGHALYRLWPDYRKEVDNYIRRVKSYLLEAKRKLLAMGYCNAVINSEINSYSLHKSEGMAIPGYISNHLNILFKQFWVYYNNGAPLQTVNVKEFNAYDESYWFVCGDCEQRKENGCDGMCAERRCAIQRLEQISDKIRGSK